MNATLSFEEALGLAIRVREELGTRFEELADHLEHSRATEPAAELREVAARQRETSAALREAAPDQPGHDSQRLRQFELPDYSAIRPHMTAHQALHIAVESEQAVYDWFAALMGQTEDPGVRRLLGDLRDEAGVWRDRLQQDLANLGREEIDPALFADDPVAH
jgi:rubrerythrin